MSWTRSSARKKRKRIIKRQRGHKCKKKTKVGKGGDYMKCCILQSIGMLKTGGDGREDCKNTVRIHEARG